MLKNDYFLSPPDISVYDNSNIYNTSCLQTLLDSQPSSTFVGISDNIDSDWGIEEPAVTACSNEGQIGGQVEEGIPYVAGNTLWAVYQVL